MLSSARISWIRIAQQAFVAGLCGAILIDAYLWVTTLLPQHGSLITLWQWVASTVLGKVALTSASYAGAGLLIHLLVSIGWAGGYAYLASRQPNLDRRWVISGIVYGFIVYIMMQVILLVDNNAQPVPSPTALVSVIIAHTIFFGLPVAFIVSRLQPRVVA